jgi:hypothetical protein
LYRWLYNVEAVRTGVFDKERSENDPHTQGPDIAWWTPENPAEAQSPRTTSFQIGDFVGHGRTMHYCGLVFAFMAFIETPERIGWIRDPGFIRIIPEFLSLTRKRPRAWYLMASVSLLLIWTELLLAVVVDFYTPTIGFGCWSGSIVLYAILSTVSWLIQFKKRPGEVLKAAAHFFNALAIVWILAATMMVVSRCLCAPQAASTNINCS